MKNTLVRTLWIGLLASACLGEDPIPAPQPAGQPTKQADLPSAPEERAAARACDGAPVPMILRGRVVSDKGGVAGLRMAMRGEDGEFREVVRTDADGHYLMETDRPVVYTVMDLVSVPGERCTHTRIPEEVLSFATAEHPLVLEQDFHVAETCPLTVQVLDPSGEGVEGAQVELVNLQYLQGLEGIPLTDAYGSTTISHAPCELVGLMARKDELLPEAEGARVPPALQVDCEGWHFTLRSEAVCVRSKLGEPTPQIVLRTRQGVLLQGRVQDTQGAPIAGAKVDTLREETTTDADGAYKLYLPERGFGSTVVRVSADGYGGAKSGAIIAGREGSGLSWKSLGSPDMTRDFVLVPIRAVEARCLGLSPDDCDQTYISCAAVQSERFGSCRGLKCNCPAEADLVVSGGGVAVTVGAEDEIAWLDFRGLQGGVSGRVEGASRCVARATRGSEWLRVATGRALVKRTAYCDEEGSFEIQRLPPGAWTVSVTRLDDIDPSGSLFGKGSFLRADSESVDVDIAQELVDVGVIQF